MIMNKLDFLNLELENGKMTDTTYKVFIALYNKPFMSVCDLAKEINMDQMSVLSHLNDMMNFEPKIVDKSADLYLTTEHGDDMITAGAKSWFEAEYPEHQYRTGGLEKRTIGKSMDEYRDYVLQSFDEGYFSNIKISRQNYKMILANKKDGFKIIEIRNDGKLRIAVSSGSKKIIDHFLKFENVRYLPASEKAYICKFDFDCSCEMIDEIVKYIKSI